MSWVATAYLLAETVATALAGKFGDLFGRKLVFQVSTIDLHHRLVPVRHGRRA